MDYKYVLYEKEGEIARITLNRPEKLNVMDFPGDGGICDDFYAAMDEAAVDDELKVVIIKGAGRAFCAGHDLTRIYYVYEEKDKEPGKRRPSQRARLDVDRPWIGKQCGILVFPKVTIAQVHGHCIGEGAIISEFCDITIVADDAHISHAEQRLGFAGAGNFLLLFQMLGYKRARELVLSGRAMDGKEAERIGWATRSVPFDKLEEEVNRTANEIALLPADGIAIGKAANHQMMDILGITQGWQLGYLTHTLFTNLRYEPDEYNFVRQRRDEGARTGFHKRDERYMKI